MRQPILFRQKDAAMSEAAAAPGSATDAAVLKDFDREAVICPPTPAAAAGSKRPAVLSPLSAAPEGWAASPHSSPTVPESSARPRKRARNDPEAMTSADGLEMQQHQEEHEEEEEQQPALGDARAEAGAGAVVEPGLSPLQPPLLQPEPAGAGDQVGPHPASPHGFILHIASLQPTHPAVRGCARCWPHTHACAVHAAACVCMCSACLRAPPKGPAEPLLLPCAFPCTYALPIREPAHPPIHSSIGVRICPSAHLPTRILPPTILPCVRRRPPLAAATTPAQCPRRMPSCQT